MGFFIFFFKLMGKEEEEEEDKMKNRKTVWILVFCSYLFIIEFIAIVYIA